jgi:peptide/nickel transport system substrate-binding protein
MKGKLTLALAGIMVLILVAPSPTLAQAAKPTGELRIAVSELGNERPSPWREMAFGKDYIPLLYDALVGSNDDGSLSTERGVAKKWEMTPDGLTWTFHLRQGIKFHNGEELTAEDVKFTLEQFIAPGAQASYAGQVRGAIKSIEIKDPYTLVIHCQKPQIFLNWLLSSSGSTEGFIAPKDYTEKVGDDGFHAKPIGSGPYKFHSQVTGSFIKLEAVDKHWFYGVPEYKFVTIRIVPEESTRIAMLKAGDVDVIGIGRERVAEVKQAGFKVFTKAGSTISGGYFHQQWDDVPVADIRVRKALNLAINREEIKEFLFAGQGEVAATYPLGSGVLLAGGDPSLEPYPYDPEEAKRLLAEAGYPPGTLTINMASYTRAGFEELPRVAEAIAGYWKKVGVDTKIEATEYASWRLRRRAKTIPGWVSFLATANRKAPSQIISITWILHHSDAVFTSMKDPAMDRLIEAAQQSTDPKEVEKLIGDMHRYMYNHYNNIPLLEFGDNYATNDKVTKWDMGFRDYDRNFTYLISE